jgi:hypothetical protein
MQASTHRDAKNAVSLMQAMMESTMKMLPVAAADAAILDVEPSI